MVPPLYIVTIFFSYPGEKKEMLFESRERAISHAYYVMRPNTHVIGCDVSLKGRFPALELRWNGSGSLAKVVTTKRYELP